MKTIPLNHQDLNKFGYPTIQQWRAMMEHFWNYTDGDIGEIHDAIFHDKDKFIEMFADMVECCGLGEYEDEKKINEQESVEETVSQNSRKNHQESVNR